MTWSRSASVGCFLIVLTNIFVSCEVNGDEDHQAANFPQDGPSCVFQLMKAVKNARTPTKRIRNAQTIRIRPKYFLHFSAAAI